MKTNKNEKKTWNVSPIVQTIDKDGKDALGFTIYYNEDLFYNVMRCFSADDFNQVLKALTEERRKTLIKIEQRRKL